MPPDTTPTAVDRQYWFLTPFLPPTFSASLENPAHVHDLHATILHQLGLDHHRLSVRLQGLDFRLTGVDPARVIKELIF